MSLNYTRDYKEIPIFANKHKGATTLEIIEGYAKKRKVVSHRISSAFWELVEEGAIITKKGEDGIERIQ